MASIVSTICKGLEISCKRKKKKKLKAHPTFQSIPGAQSGRMTRKNSTDEVCWR